MSGGMYIGRKAELDFFYGKCQEFIRSYINSLAESRYPAMAVSNIEEQLLHDRHHEPLDVPTMRAILRRLQAVILSVAESAAGVSPELLARIAALENAVSGLTATINELTAATSLLWNDTTSTAKTLYASNTQTSYNSVVVEQEATGISITYQVPVTLTLTASDDENND